MKLFDNIKYIADARNITIAAIESDIGLGNGRMKGWNESYPSIDKVMKVAEYLGFPITLLMAEDMVEEYSKVKRVQRPVSEAKVIEVIETKVCIGAGTEEDPNRNLWQYWSLTGELLAEKDDIENTL